MPISEQQERLIQQTLRYFNWAKVEKVMEFLDWKWILPNRTGLHRPTQFQMQQSCYRHLCDSVKYGTVGSGGFMARYFNEDDYERFTLTFELTGWDVDTDGLEDYETGTPEELDAIRF